MAWVYIAVDRNAYSALWEFKGTTFSQIIQTDADGTTLGLWNGSTFPTGTNLSAGTWYHIAMVSDASPGAGSFRLYLNGVLDITNTGPSGGVATSLDFFDGNTSGLLFNGRMRSLKIYSAALTPTEINTERASLDTCVRSSNLNSFYKFDSAATIATDDGGSSLTLTVNGTFTTEAGPP